MLLLTTVNIVGLFSVNCALKYEQCRLLYILLRCCNFLVSTWCTNFLVSTCSTNLLVSTCISIFSASIHSCCTEGALLFIVVWIVMILSRVRVCNNRNNTSTVGIWLCASILNLCRCLIVRVDIKPLCRCLIVRVDQY